VGQFTSTVPLRVVSLQDPPPVPSLFDEQRRHLRTVTAFLRGFVEEATQVVNPSDWQNLEYVPTQVVAETFRYDLPVDGILWRSSKDPSVTSCVLFISNTEVADPGCCCRRNEARPGPSDPPACSSPDLSQAGQPNQ
jgi:hypothetical protein